jgi:hypothetical protein
LETLIVTRELVDQQEESVNGYNDIEAAKLHCMLTLCHRVIVDLSAWSLT